MPEYMQRFVIECQWGYGYLATNAMQLGGALVEWLVCCLACLAMDSVCYALFGEWQMDHIVLDVFLALYTVVRSRYDVRGCLVRGWMFMASTMVMLPISEPLGRMFAAINQAHYA